MEYRKLGKNGPLVSVIGFGSWAVGGGGWEGSWGFQDDRLSIQSIRCALDAGINFFDTAPAYGLGHSETILGKALKSNRNNVVIATKCGLVWDTEKKITKDVSYASVIQQAEASLRRLDTDYIDLLLVHWPDNATPIDETLLAMQKLVQDGKVRYIGVSNFNIRLLNKSLAVCHLDALQPPYSVLRPAAETDLLPHCLNNGIGVIAYSPLASGLLSGKYTTDSRFTPEDWRSRSSWHIRQGLQKNLARVEKLKPIASELRITLPQLAIAYILAHPALTSALIGTRATDHILSLLPASEIKLSPSVISEVRKIAFEAFTP
ncbi:aldo/keto reductase [Cohnella soli]|uniref:Aldo/keto reductase n=1 Tax=Cohnella soli TaxID=425005 RepID=A0ABW0I3X8_9BACL